MTDPIPDSQEALPPRVVAAERRREFRRLLERSSLGCPLGQCGHLIGDHFTWKGYDRKGNPIDPVCNAPGCTCGGRDV